MPKHRPDATYISLSLAFSSRDTAAEHAAQLASAKLDEALARENKRGLKVFTLLPPSEKVGGAQEALGLTAAMCLWLAKGEGTGALSGRTVCADWDVEDLLRHMAEIEGDDTLFRASLGH
jgi:hypothetical protein